NHAEKKIVLYGVSWCSDCHRARYLLDAFGIEYIDIDVDENEVSLEVVKQINGGNRVVPTIIFPDNSILVEPSNEELAEKLGVSLEELV
ncbi:MAG: glutaredoxin domain-containing protein, partial [Anaerolineae bacterium]